MDNSSKYSCPAVCEQDYQAGLAIEGAWGEVEQKFTEKTEEWGPCCLWFFGLPHLRGASHSVPLNFEMSPKTKGENQTK